MDIGEFANRVVVFEEGHTAVLAADDDAVATSLLPVMQTAAEEMLCNVRAACTANCEAFIDSSHVTGGKENSSYHTIGVICVRASDGPCPEGVRHFLITE